jgi:hypothetical protein
VQSVRPPAGQVAKHPVAAGFEPFVGGAQIEHQGDAAAAALQLTHVVGGDRMKSDHTRVEAIGAMRIILEHVGDEMREAARDGFGRRGAHQCGSQQELASITRQYREAPNFRDPMPPDELIDVHRRIEELEPIRRILRQRRGVMDAQNAGRAPANMGDEPCNVVAIEIRAWCVHVRICDPAFFALIGRAQHLNDLATCCFVEHARRLHMLACAHRRSPT